ncbi:MAG: undecaprenyl-diphosphatase [Patescibacteria group bacterium]|nr:undecaprenyl-diphosphatase [Patescibacteria group bacterium]MDE1971034.1 undecaprenyl-diphosphatase [Patescibacteria group bacterium]
MDSFFIFCAKYLFVLPALILAVYFFMQPRAGWKRMIIFAVCSAVLAFILAKIGSLLIYDPRPFVVGNFVPLVPHAADNGFPSDHALLVSAIAMIGTVWNRKMGAALWVLAILVAVSRVYVGVHHTADVVGSFAISIASVIIVLWLMRKKQAVPQ